MLLFATLLTFAGTGAVSAAEPPGDSADPMASDAEAEGLFEQDVARMAEEQGWSVEYTRARLQTMDDIDAAMTEVARLPDYAGGYWDVDEGSGLTILFHHAVPDGVLDEVRAQAQVPIEAKVVPDRHLPQVQRRVERLLERLDGVRSWNAGIDQREQTVGVTVLVADDRTGARIEARLAKAFPDGVLDVGTKVAPPLPRRPLRDVCLRVDEPAGDSVDVIAQRVRQGTTTVLGPGTGCLARLAGTTPRDGVCLRVAGSEEPTTRAIARDVRQGKASVRGPGQACGSDPVPLVGKPIVGLEDILEVPVRRLEIDAVGGTARVHYDDGPFACRGLDHVELSTDDTGFEARVFAGFRPDVISCVGAGTRWVTVVPLDEAIAQPDEG